MAERRLRLRRGLVKIAPPADVAPNSLFGEILDWMLAPLLLLWPISIVATNHVANHIANQPYDQHLADDVIAISRLVRFEGTRTIVNLPTSARMLLRSDERDTLYYQVAQGERILQGDAELSPPEAAAEKPLGRVLFSDDTIDGDPVRIAYLYLSHPQSTKRVSIQVAETRHKREALASSIISGVLLPQFAIIPLAVILVWTGLTRGIAPLRVLRSRIQRRRADDLSPLSVERVPDEVRPLVQAFNEMMAQLDANLKAQQRFIADAAHQMRTPLTGLKMQTELALRESDPQRMREALELIFVSTERAAHLIHQLLVLARTEASQAQSRPEPVDLHELARRVTLDWVDRALAKPIDLGFEGIEEACWIEGVPLLLRELLSNLIDNAIKYSPPERSVTVRVTADAVLEVEDEGIGIPEEDRARVFERFYRVLGTDADGSGLGLPIAAEIAELHHASIDLLPGPRGRGCLFHIAFPKMQGPGPSGQTFADTRSPSGFPVGL